MWRFMYLPMYPECLGGSLMAQLIVANVMFASSYWAVILKKSFMKN